VAEAVEWCSVAGGQRVGHAEMAQRVGQHRRLALHHPGGRKDACDSSKSE